MKCPNCKKSFFWGETTLRFTFAGDSVVSCRHCREQIELVEGSSDDISDIIFNFVRCWIVPLLLAGVPLELFSREPFFATGGFLAIILWQLREYEATHYDLRLKSVEKNSETESSHEM
jgi:hypothetical protein